MRLKKIIFSFSTCAISAILLFLAYPAPVFEETSMQDSYQYLSSARAEQIEWRYRTYKGKKQKRLWSITYEKWLTKWLPA